MHLPLYTYTPSIYCTLYRFKPFCCTIVQPFFFLHRCTLFYGTVVNSFIVPFYTLLLYRCALYYCTVVNHLRLFSLNIHVGHNIDAYTFENWVLCTVCLYSVHVLYTHQLRTDDESMYLYITVVQMYSVRLVSNIKYQLLLKVILILLWVSTVKIITKYYSLSEI